MYGSVSVSVSFDFSLVIFCLFLSDSVSFVLIVYYFTLLQFYKWQLVL